jgi:predicted aconitase with swiveling domain
VTAIQSLGIADLIIGGPASAPLVVLQESLSFWGGVDEQTGKIIDRHHQQQGVGLAGTALLMGAPRGSSSSSSTLLECIRLNTAPAILVLTEPDALLVVGVAAAWEIYGRGPTILKLPAMPDWTGIRSISVDMQGGISGSSS